MNTIPELIFDVAYDLKAPGECPLVRVSKEAYNTILEIAASTGLPMYRIASEMIMFAGKYVCIRHKKERSDP